MQRRPAARSKVHVYLSDAMPTPGIDEVSSIAWSLDRLLVGLRDRSGLLEFSAPGWGLGLGLVCSSSVIRPSQTNGRTRGLRG